MRRTVRKGFALILTLALALAALAGCGGTEETVLPEETTPISGELSLVVLPGAGETLASALPDDFEVTVAADLDAAEGSVYDGSADLAILPANTAAYLVNRTGGGLSALSPVTLGGFSVYTNGAYIPEGEIGYLRGKTIVACGQGGAGDYVLRQLLRAAGVNPDYRVEMKWVATPQDVLDALSEEDSVALLQEPYGSQALSVPGVTRVLELDNLWKALYNVPIPSDVLVVSSEFASERGDELPAILEAFATALGETADQVPGLVLYQSSNRGMAILRDYLVLMAGQDPESVGGTLPADAFYLGTGE